MRKALFAALAACMVCACRAGPGDTKEDAPVLEAAATLVVQTGESYFQMYSEDAKYAAKGGWFEKKDAPPEEALKGANYEDIDPKKAFEVIKTGAGGTEIALLPDEFAVVVCDADGTARENTRLSTLGKARLKIVYLKNKSAPVKYKKIGEALKDDFFTVEVTSCGSDGKELAGYEVVRQPRKLEYDWEEPFESAGLEVLAWYGAMNLEKGGIPVIAESGDYMIDDSAYTQTYMPGESGFAPKPVSSPLPCTLYVAPPAGKNAAAQKASFVIRPVYKEYAIKTASPDGQQTYGGFITPNNPKQKVASEVMLRFQTESGYKLNADSVRVKYDGGEITPVWSNDSLTPDGVVNVDAENKTLNASFSMPRADVTVVAEFSASNTRLTNLSAGPTPETLQPMPGFNPGISAYTYCVLDTNQVVIKAESGADITFEIDSAVSSVNTSVSDKTCTISNLNTLGTNDCTLTINSRSGTNAKSYTVTVKRFNNNRIAYTYTGGVQTFIPPADGTYTFTAWGAYGGNSPNYDSGGGDGFGGKPGKAWGTLIMKAGAPAWNAGKSSGSWTGADGVNAVYIYVGEGGFARKGFDSGRATYNGGGAGGAGGAYGAGSGGGGATSISLTRGAWSDWQVLIDRIMVAGGGGGYGHNNGRAGAGGGLVAQGGRVHGGYNVANCNDVNTETGYGGTVVQNGYWTGAGQRYGSGRGGQGFGIGGKGASPPGYGGSGAEGRGGGGGGYFGGEITFNWTGNNSNAGGGGGSGYVSGFLGCVSYNGESKANWMVPVTQSKPTNDQLDPENVKTHYSGRSFTNAGMCDISKDLWQYNAGIDDSPAKTVKPVSGLGAIGASNYDGYVLIEYIPSP